MLESPSVDPSLSMKFVIFAAIFLSGLFVTANAQATRPHGLVLSGSVISVSPEFTYYREELPFVVYSVGLRLVLRNDGEVPVIIFRPERCEQTIEFLSYASDDAAAEVTAEPWAHPDASRYADRGRDPLSNYAEYAKRLEIATDPSKAGLIVIEPGRVFEFALSVKLNAGYSLEIRPGQVHKDVRRSSPKSDFAGLRVVFHESFKKVRPDVAFLKNLQTKWKNFGLLLVDGNGEFTLKSEMILNKTN